MCLVCKQLHEIAVRPLYHEVTLDVGSAEDVRLAALLHPRNIGLQHVRKLDLYLADVLDKCNQLQQANFAIRMILELLPENQLEKFSWHPWSPFSGDNLLLLYKKQKCMKWMESISLDRDVLQELEKVSDIAKSFQHVRKIGLYPDSREVLDFCHFLLKSTVNRTYMCTFPAPAPSALFVADGSMGPEQELTLQRKAAKLQSFHEQLQTEEPTLKH